jgi:hypothetical protein
VPLTDGTDKKNFFRYLHIRIDCKPACNVFPPGKKRFLLYVCYNNDGSTSHHRDFFSLCTSKFRFRHSLYAIFFHLNQQRSRFKVHLCRSFRAQKILTRTTNPDLQSGLVYCALSELRRKNCHVNVQPRSKPIVSCDITAPLSNLLERAGVRRITTAKRTKPIPGSLPSVKSNRNSHINWHHCKTCSRVTMAHSQ